MANLPDDVMENLKRLSEEVEVPMRDLVKKMGEIIKNDETIQSMKEREHKIRFGFAILYREYSMVGKTTDVYLMPVSTPQVRAIKMKGENTYVGNVQGLMKIIPGKDDDEVDVEDKWEYAAGTFWREGAKEAEEMERGKVYHCKLRLTDNDWGKGISIDQGPFKKVDDVEAPDIEEFFKDEIADRDIEINIGEIDLNESENETDIFMFEGTIIGSNVSDRADGSSYGMYNIMDYSIAGNQATVFLHPDDVEWAQGSVCNFIGTIQVRKNDKTHRWQNHLVVPKIGIPREVSIPEPEKETVDIDEAEPTDEEKEEKKETKKSDKKEDSKKDDDDDIPIEF
jgi:hypothetical protein